MTRNTPRILKEGRFLRFVSRDGWEYVERTNATGIVVICAVSDDARLILVEQYRPPVDARTVELPAGLAGDVPGADDEAIEEAARRELIEETGYAADRMEPLLVGPISSGLSSEVATFFLAPDARRVGEGGGDESEEIRVHAVPLDEVDAWLRDMARGGALIDPKVYAALYFANLRRR